MPGVVPAAAALVVLAIGAACGAGPGSSGRSSEAERTGSSSARSASSTPAGSPEDEAAGERFELPAGPETGEGSLLSDDGTISTDTLLAWWAAAIEPVSGVDPLSDERIGGRGAGDLLRLIATRDVPGPVRTRIEELHRGTSPVGLGFSAPRAPSRDDLTQAQAEELVRTARARLEGWLGEPVGIDVEVEASDDPLVFDGPMVGAVATVVYNPVTRARMSNCNVKIRRSGGPVIGVDEWRLSSAIHELYHCYQHSLFNDSARMDAQPQWVVEGTAAYVGEKVGGNSLWSDLWMEGWLHGAPVDLRRRAYTAIGLYWLMDDVGIPMKQRFDELLTSRGDTPERLRVALGSNAADITGRWGSHVVNRDWGVRWRPPAAARFPVGSRPDPTAFTYGVGGRPALLTLSGTRAGVFEGATRGDLLTIGVRRGTWGAVRLPDGTDLVLTAGEHHFCLSDQACTPCPDSGRHPLGDGPTRSTPGPLTVGVMATVEGVVAIQGWNWADECGEEAVDPVPEPVVEGVCAEWMSPADFRAITGIAYANAWEDTRGECVFEDARFEILARLEALPGATAQSLKYMKDVWVDGPDIRCVVVTGWQLGALCPGGTQFVGVHQGYEFFATTFTRAITAEELMRLMRHYLAQR